jgi:hypothetical protein
VFRPEDTTVCFRHTNTQGVADFEFVAGESDWRPVAGHFGELSRKGSSPSPFSSPDQ